MNLYKHMWLLIIVTWILVFVSAIQTIAILHLRGLI